MDVFPEVAALKRSYVFCTELSSLDVNETTIPLIQVSRGPTTSFQAAQYGGGYRVSSTTLMPAKTGLLGLLEAEEV